VLLVALAGCGSGERTFDAQDFAAELSDRGVTLELGEPLQSESETVDAVYGVDIADGEASNGAQAGDGSGGGGKGEEAHPPGGSLTITSDSDAAVAEYQRCEAAVSLLCYRAANALLVFDDALPPEDQARVERAIRALGEE
jgi:hypothetical protein